MKLPEFGPHAKQRQAYHSITIKQIAETLVYGVTRPGGDGTLYHVGPEITPVVAPSHVFVVTMFPNKWADRFNALSAAVRKKEAQDGEGGRNQPPAETQE